MTYYVCTKHPNTFRSWQGLALVCPRCVEEEHRAQVAAHTVHPTPTDPRDAEITRLSAEVERLRKENNKLREEEVGLRAEVSRLQLEWRTLTAVSEERDRLRVAFDALAQTVAGSGEVQDKLRAEMERLTAENEHLREQAVRWADDAACYHAEVERLTAAIDRKAPICADCETHGDTYTQELCAAYRRLRKEEMAATTENTRLTAELAERDAEIASMRGEDHADRCAQSRRLKVHLAEAERALAELQRGESICTKCGLRKDGVADGGTPF